MTNCPHITLTGDRVAMYLGDEIRTYPVTYEGGVDFRHDLTMTGCDGSNVCYTIHHCDEPAMARALREHFDMGGFRI